MGSDTGLSVIALSMYLKTSSINAGQPEKNLTQDNTYITFIKFHIDLRDKANITVMISWATTTVFAAYYTLSFVASNFATTSLLGSIFGSGCSIIVPG